MSKKKILYLALNLPEIGTSSTLYTDLMETFRDHGHEVYVVASSLETGKDGLFDESGIKVLRTKTWSQRDVNVIQKGIANVLLPMQYKKAIKKHLNDITFDLIISPTPPITLGSVLSWLKKKSKTPIYLILRDIFPQNAVDLGMMKKNGLIHKYFSSLEKKLYNTVDAIGCMSEGNIQFVKQNNPEVDTSKLHILRNWQREQQLPAVNKLEIKKKHNLNGKFIVFFGGNISKPQKVENIINLASLYMTNDKVVFYIVGRGNHKEKLKNLVVKNGLNNVIIKDFLPRKDYQALMQIADVGLVSLDPNFTIPNIPSKALSYFNSKIPVIALIDKNTDFGTWIEDEVNCGFWAEADKPELLKDKMDVLLEDHNLVSSLGENGYNYFVKHLNPEVAYQTIIKFL